MEVWLLVITLVFGDGKVQNKIITPPDMVSNRGESCTSAGRAISAQILEQFQKLDANIRVFSACVPIDKDSIDNATSVKS